MIPQTECVVQILHRQRVLGNAGHRREVADFAQREHQMIVRHLDQLAAFALGDANHLLLRIDVDDPAPPELRLRHEIADGIDDVIWGNAAGRHFGEKRLKHEIVFLRQELDVHVVPAAEHAREVLRGVHAGKAAAQHDDALLDGGVLFFRRRFRRDRQRAVPGSHRYDSSMNFGQDSTASGVRQIFPPMAWARRRAGPPNSLAQTRLQDTEQVPWDHGRVRRGSIHLRADARSCTPREHRRHRE